MTSRLLPVSVFATLLLLVGCDNKTKPSEQPASEAKPDAVVVPTPPAAGHGGGVVELGETTVEGMKIRASRDVGVIKPGGDSPIDIWIDGGLGGASAVRFWIGTEDAKGSVKAKADVENNHWHTHAEVPDPLPADSMLWVEIEGAGGGKKTTVNFKLKS